MFKHSKYLFIILILSSLFGSYSFAQGHWNPRLKDGWANSKTRAEKAKAMSTYINQKIIYQASIDQNLRPQFARISYDARGVFSRPEQIPRITVESGLPYKIMQFRNEPIYYFVFSNIFDSGLAVERLDMYAETMGKVLTDGDLNDHILKLNRGDGLNGTDYSGEDIAKFFTLALKQNIKINPIEKGIKDTFMGLGLLKRQGNIYSAVKPFAFLGSVQGPDPDGTVAHELNHGIYFTDDSYRLAAYGVWFTLPKIYQDYVVKTMNDWADIGYDFKGHHDLFIREFIAYFRDGLDSLDPATSKQLAFISKKIHDIDKLSHVYSEDNF